MLKRVILLIKHAKVFLRKICKFQAEYAEPQPPSIFVPGSSPINPAATAKTTNQALLAAIIVPIVIVVLVAAGILIYCKTKNSNEYHEDFRSPQANVIEPTMPEPQAIPEEVIYSQQQYSAAQQVYNS